MIEIRPQKRFDVYTLAALLLALFSFTMSAVISRAVFERLPRLEDEVAYLFQAEVFARGDIMLPSPSPGTPFWKPFIVDEGGNRFSKYTPGWSAWLAVGVITGEPWVANAFFAMLTVVLTFRLASEIFNRDVGIVAAALLAFSPIALLLSGSLMGHTSALFFATLFMYGYWRVAKPSHRDVGAQYIAPLRSRIGWGVLAGFALGMLVVNRPLSGIAIAAPFVLWSLIRLVETLVRDRAQFVRILTPLIALGVVASVISLAIPFYNYLAVGDPTTNLYTLVWDYDKVGFGETYGRSGHTLEKGIQFARYDLSLLAADLFGWQQGLFDTGLQQQLVDIPVGSADRYWALFGLSWLPLVPGLAMGFKKRWAWLWVASVGVWIWWLSEGAVDNNLTVWLIFGLILWFSPLVFILTEKNDHRPIWTWLFLAVAVTLVTVHLAYWIGSQRYSTRYYFELVSALCIIAAIAIGGLIHLLRRPGLKMAAYGVFGLLCLWSLVMYSTPRIDVLRGYNRVTETMVEEVNRRRTTDKPVLVLVEGPEVGKNPSWRSYGALMVATNPYLDSEIVAAWDNGREGTRERLIAMFPDREVIDMKAMDAQRGDHSWFIEDCPPDGGECPIINPPREW
jgi:4-amino-4-deoxy-L-arabinose transferase-like glycosyltransferase